MKFYINIFFVITFVSCGVLPKGGVSYFGEEKVFSKQLKSYPTTKRVAQGREPGWELGIAFIPHKEGRIKGVWLKNPTLGAVPVSIWDADTKQLIKTLQFTINDTLSYNHFILSDPILLQAEKKYCITVNVTKYYYYTLQFSTLPIQLNNCSLVNSVYEETYYQRYPQYEINNVVHGLIDVDLDWKQ
jgi:hypothetical protein